MLLEGTDELRLTYLLLLQDRRDGFVLLDMGGNRTHWSTELQTIAQDGQFKLNVTSVGLVTDADANPAAAFQRCTDALAAIGFPTPAQNGEVAVAAARRGGVFVMPGGASTGALEDLLLQVAVPQRVHLARQYLASVRSAGLDGPRVISKGEVQAYMAGLRQSPKTLNVGLRAQGAFDLTHPALNAFRQHLADLEV